MMRGTTPTITFTLPIPTAAIDSGYVTFAQSGSVKIDKSLSDCERKDNKVSVTLSQSETLSLSADITTEIQLALRCGSKVFRSKIMRVQTDRILKDGEI